MINRSSFTLSTSYAVRYESGQNGFKKMKKNASFLKETFFSSFIPIQWY
ncbi:hypothetical protein HS9_03491 [Bacillus velezensis]|nr:hypothetical protein HS9_03491 [Bacillus velezensis]